MDIGRRSFLTSVIVLRAPFVGAPGRDFASEYVARVTAFRDDIIGAAVRRSAEVRSNVAGLCAPYINARLA